MITITAQIFSPRWGHHDKYVFELTDDEMTISMGPRKSKCVWQTGKDPEWQGELFEKILRNDSIYPPSILPRMLEHLWISWRNGELNDSDAQMELDAVTEWLNTITESKPKTDFWGKYF